MKLMLFIDKIYSKIFIVYYLLTMILIPLSIYLYFKLPPTIPVHWATLFKIDGWGNKVNIFLLPLVALGLCVVFSKKIIDEQELVLLKRVIIEAIVVVILTFLFILIGYTYSIYFKMI